MDRQIRRGSARMQGGDFVAYHRRLNVAPRSLHRRDKSLADVAA